MPSQLGTRSEDARGACRAFLCRAGSRGQAVARGTGTRPACLPPMQWGNQAPQLHLEGDTAKEPPPEAGKARGAQDSRLAGPWTTQQILREGRHPLPRGDKEGPLGRPPDCGLWAIKPTLPPPSSVFRAKSERGQDGPAGNTSDGRDPSLRSRTDPCFPDACGRPAFPGAGTSPCRAHGRD